MSSLVTTGSRQQHDTGIYRAIDTCVCVRLEPVRNDNSTYAHMGRYVTLHCSYRLLNSRRHLHTFIIQVLLLYLLRYWLVFRILFHINIYHLLPCYEGSDNKITCYRLLENEQKTDGILFIRFKYKILFVTQYVTIK